jgi:pyruvate/2-oxoglutarate dehydrogenase complex dihydrolipoamide dehydrogenase (E3) component
VLHCGRAFDGFLVTITALREADMKTLIVGAGIIGTIYGWALAEAGVDVRDGG